MAVNVRRPRGALLRLARARGTAVTTGTVLLAPSVWLFVGDYGWESWVSDGLGLVLGATGAALILVGLGGRRPDWIDPDQ